MRTDSDETVTSALLKKKQQKNNKKQKQQKSILHITFITSSGNSLELIKHLPPAGNLCIKIRLRKYFYFIWLANVNSI